MAAPLISKSKYLCGLQCPKLLWTHYNDRESLPPTDAATQAVFNQGHEVGRLAQQRYPGGIEVPWDQGIPATIRQSQGLLARRRPIFEGSFSHGGVYSRADILNPVGRREWDLIEVKSATGVHDINLDDVALQRYCYQGAGLRIRGCFVLNIDSTYVRQGEVDPGRLFKATDVTAETAELLGEVPERVAAMRKVIASKKCPAPGIGPHCQDPYECPLMESCWNRVWDHDDHIFSLVRMGAKAWQLYERGITRNGQIPDDFRPTALQSIQLAAERTGRLQVNVPAVREWLAALSYPLYLLDFETFMTAIPLIDRSRPYEQIPFQFSLHIQQRPDTKLAHHAWLWDGKGDPREIMLASLKPLLGTRGSVVAYNSSFEKNRLKEAAEAYPFYGSWYRRLESRIVDLAAPFRSFNVYHPQQHGSASLKSVLPALTGKGYDGLEIAEGGTASREFLRVMFTDASVRERHRVRRQLEAYCETDTKAMHDLLQVLRKLTSD